MTNETDGVIAVFLLVASLVTTTIISLFAVYWSLTSPIAQIWGTPHPIIVFGLSFVFFGYVVFSVALEIFSGAVGNDTGTTTTTTAPPTNDTETTTSETYEPEPDNPSTDILDEDRQDTSGYNRDRISIDETPGRSRTEYENIDTDVGSDEPRFSDRRNQGYSGKTAYSEDDDDEFSPDIDVDLGEI